MDPAPLGTRNEVRSVSIATLTEAGGGIAVFLIFGLRTKAERMGPAAGVCRVCGQAGTLHLVRESTRLSIFFIPLIRIRTKYAVHCTNPLCGARTPVSGREADRLLAGVAG